jgi:hypothetical protein
LRAPDINFHLAFVLHTHALVSNLISVHKFTRDNLRSVEFDPFGFSTKDLLTRTTILRSNSLGVLSTGSPRLQITSRSPRLCHQWIFGIVALDILVLHPFCICFRSLICLVPIIARHPPLVRHATKASMLVFHFQIRAQSLISHFRLFTVIFGLLLSRVLLASTIT